MNVIGIENNGSHESLFDYLWKEFLKSHDALSLGTEFVTWAKQFIQSNHVIVFSVDNDVPRITLSNGVSVYVSPPRLDNIRVNATVGQILG